MARTRFGATVLAMLWAAWAGRDRGEPHRDDSDEAMRRIQRALAASMPSAPPVEPRREPVSHGVVVGSHGIVRGLDVLIRGRRAA